MRMVRDTFCEEGWKTRNLEETTYEDKGMIGKLTKVGVVGKEEADHDSLISNSIHAVTRSKEVFLLKRLLLFGEKVIFEAQ